MSIGDLRKIRIRRRKREFGRKWGYESGLKRLMEYKYDHFGVPVKQKQSEMIYFPEYKVWCSDYEKDPYRIEWIFFEKESPMHPLIQSVSHVCFLVTDIEKAVLGKKMLMEPTQYQGYQMAFIEENGIPIEFIQPPIA